MQRAEILDINGVKKLKNVFLKNALQGIIEVTASEVIGILTPGLGLRVSNIPAANIQVI
jgi:hypothetical protein